MKKLIALVLVLILTASVFLTGCESDQHVHSFDISQVKEPTCTEKGSVVLTCACGESKTRETAPAKGHTYQLAEGTVLTPDQNGKITLTCACGHSMDVQVKAQGGDTPDTPVHTHAYTLEGVTKPTCTTKGTVDLRCSCGVLLTVESAPAKGHTYELKSTQPATPTSDGQVVLVCADGDDTLTIPVKYEAGNTPADGEEYTPATCTTPGKLVRTKPDGGKETVTIPALGHDPDGDPQDYFALHACRREGCDWEGRLESDRPFRSIMTLNLTVSDREKAYNCYTAIVNRLQSLGAYDASKHGYRPSSTLAAECDELLDQMDILEDYYDKGGLDYFYAAILYDVSGSDADYEIYMDAYDFSATVEAMYFSLYGAFYDSALREYFFYGYSQEEIEQMLADTAWAGEQDVADLQSQAEELMGEIESMDDSDSRLYGKYAELVKINNQLATYYGYDNYYEYASAVEYGRMYDYEETKKLYAFVKTYVVDLFNQVEDYLEDAQSLLQDSQVINAYNSLTDSDIFRNDYAYRAVTQYLATMHNTDLDMYAYAKELFYQGNYFTGVTEGAYTWENPTGSGLPVLYFCTDDYYSGAFTFVHEFGHYANAIYNSGYSVDFDLSETQSQGNEIIFLAFLKTKLANEGKLAGKSSAYAKAYDLLVAQKLDDFLYSIIRSALVDEFEHAVYTGSYQGTGLNLNRVTQSDYRRILTDLVNAYEFYDVPGHYVYIAGTSPCYYISYAVSALPALTLYSIAEEQGMAAAMDSYFRLITFTDNRAFVSSDESGKYITASFEQVLAYAGLSSPFSQGLYEKLSSYFSSFLEGDLAA